MNVNLTLNQGESEVTVTSRQILDWQHTMEYSEWLFLTQGRETVTIERSEAVRFAKAILDAVAASDYDQFLIAQYEERKDAEVEFMSAHWGHD
jgi:hypothetical protein